MGESYCGHASSIVDYARRPASAVVLVARVGRVHSELQWDVAVVGDGAGEVVGEGAALVNADALVGEAPQRISDSDRRTGTRPARAVVAEVNVGMPRRVSSRVPGVGATRGVTGAGGGI